MSNVESIEEYLQPLVEKHNQAFSGLVHQLLVVEKKRPVQAVAHALGMKYATFYARVKGRVPFSIGEINALLREIPDPRLVSCVLGGTPYLPVARPQGESGRSWQGMLEQMAECVSEGAQALRVLQVGPSPEGPEEEERVRIEAHLAHAERALAAVRHGLEGLKVVDAREGAAMGGCVEA